MKRLDAKREYEAVDTTRLEAFVLAESARLTQEITDRTDADTALDARIDILEAAPSGSGNAVDVVVDFGSSFTHYTTGVVTGETWVTATSKIVAMSSGGNPMENAILQFSATVSDLVVGDGFTLSVYTPAKAKGTYTFSCLGV